MTTIQVYQARTRAHRIDALKSNLIEGATAGVLAGFVIAFFIA